MAKKKFLFSWPKFWANECISATVENGDKDEIVVTFTSIKPFNRAVKGEFTTTGTNRTCSTLTKVLPSNGVGTHKLSLTLNSAYANGNSITLVFNPTGKGVTCTKTVTNNIAP